MRSFFFCFLFLFSVDCLAKFHFEPYAGYGLTFTGSQLFNPTEDSPSTSYRHVQEGEFYHGFSGGARIGYSRLGLAFGLDLTWGRITGSSNNLTPVLYGAFASYKLPLFFRVYGTLIPGHLGQWTLSHMYITPRSEDRSTVCAAWGGKLGVSYLSLPFLSINFEYQPLHISGPENCQSLLSHSLIASINFIL